MKSVHILVDPKVETKHTYPIYSAFADLLDALGIRGYFELHDLGAWREPDYLDYGVKVPYKSVDWFLESAYHERVDRSCLNINTANLVSNLKIYAMKKKIDYTIFITERITIHPSTGLTFGATSKYYSSIFSLHHFHQNDADENKAIYHLALHEFGHLFGLILDTSRPHLSSSHCPDNYCIMSPYSVNKKLNGCASFCQTCLRELRQFVDHVKSSSKVQIV